MSGEELAPGPLVGVLAIQGDFDSHARVLRRLGCEVREVRVAHDLEGLHGLVIPGGESTTMTIGIEREALAEPLRALAGDGTPILGTCAGLIMLDREHLGILDIGVERNAFGSQAHSFEADLRIAEIAEEQPLRAVFIRAPRIADHGEGVSILATIEGHGVAARAGDVLAVAFHPELGADQRVHSWLLERARDRQAREAPSG